MCIIIGAGPAGLAVAGRLARANQPFTLLEASDQVGNAWRQHYNRLHLHTVKEYSALPHLPYPADYPAYVPKDGVVRYLEMYTAHFGIEPLFNQTVTDIRRDVSGWIVTTGTGSFAARQVVVSTGYNRVPNDPALPGQAHFRGNIIHSRSYRTGAAYTGKRVLVVGMGNTGAEIALDLYEQGARPFISVRSPVHIVQRDSFGRPTQPTAIFLNKFPNWFYDFMAGLSQKLTVGDLSAYGLQTPPYSPSYGIRAFGKILVINVGTLEQIKAGTITVMPGIEEVGDDSVTFTDGRSLPFDVIIKATGYRPGLNGMLGNDLSADVLNEKGYPRHLWFDEPGLDGLYFLGFKIPLMGILNNINADSGRIVDHLRRNNSVPV